MGNASVKAHGHRRSRFHKRDKHSHVYKTLRVKHGRRFNRHTRRYRGGVKGISHKVVLHNVSVKSSRATESAARSLKSESSEIERRKAKTDAAIEAAQKADQAEKEARTKSYGL
jgi:hypothetical protein